MNDSPQQPQSRPAILHVCTREMLRPVRDEILRLSGYDVDSTLSITQALSMCAAKAYDLVLIDVEGERGVHEAEQLCSNVKDAKPDQIVAFVCNWRVAILSTCPDDIVRTEFDPAAFVSGVREVLAKHAAESRS